MKNNETKEINNLKKEPVNNKIKQKIPFKTRFFYFILFSLAAVSVVFYYYIKTTQESKNECNQGIEYLETLNKEQERCSNILTQESGNFEEYDYCRNFMQMFPKNLIEEETN